MKCPNCGKEMLVGKVESGREITWIKEGEKPRRISSKLFFSSTAYAERCEECKVVIIKEAE